MRVEGITLLRLDRCKHIKNRRPPSTRKYTCIENWVHRDFYAQECGFFSINAIPHIRLHMCRQIDLRLRHVGPRCGPTARPRGRSGWRAQIARPASRRLPCARPAPRRLPSALRRGKASPQRGNEENAPQRLVRRLRGCGGLQKRVRGRRFGVSDAARPRDEEAEPRRRRIAGCAAHEAPGGGRKRAVAGRRARRKAKAVPPNSTRVATRGLGRGRSRAEPF